MHIDINSVKELKNKIKACNELGLKYELSGELNEVEYDFMDGQHYGQVRSYDTEIRYLELYRDFNPKEFKTKKIKLHDGLGGHIDLEVLVTKHKGEYLYHVPTKHKTYLSVEI